MRKKRVLFHSDFALAKTGFGRAMRCLLTHLYKTGKYDIHQLCCGIPEDAQELSITPWKSYGAVPSNQAELQELQRDPNLARMAAYGSKTIDKHIKNIKPDVYIGTQDFWGLDYVIEKAWTNTINSALWITLDSLPILPSAVLKAPEIKNYWVWSNFAEKALKALGHDHVKTVHGPIDAKYFHKLGDEERKELRRKNNLPEDAFIIGFVFRNQLRKLVPNLLEGYQLWKKQNPNIKNTYLLLHTNFSEGWNIKAQAEQYGVDTKEILTTYICRNCGGYEVKTFDNREDPYQRNSEGSVKKDKFNRPIPTPLDPQNQNCNLCKTANSQITTGVGLGITEKELNEVYNLMDVYAHPFTSGGQEIPIQEAKLCELITLVTDYSCGEESCEKGAASLPLEWSKYLEHGTEFIKASTYPSSIAKQINRVYNMTPKERVEWGKKAREWAIKGFSIESVSAQIEKFLDDSPLLDETKEDNYQAGNKSNPKAEAEISKDLADGEWVLSLYKNILDREVDETNDGYLYWMAEIVKGSPKDQIENYFRHVAREEVREKEKETTKEKVDPFRSQLDEKEKRILYVMPESAGDIFLSTSLFKSIKSRYPDHDLYVATKKQFKEILNANPYVHKWLEYQQNMDNLLFLEGNSNHNGYFDIAYLPHIATQRALSYLHNGLDKIDFKLTV